LEFGGQAGDATQRLPIVAVKLIAVEMISVEALGVELIIVERDCSVCHRLF